MKYDRDYFLHERNNSIFLWGDEGSFIQLENSRWKLTSLIHNVSYYLDNAIVPFGRNDWVFDKTQEKVTLTFTMCKEHEFSCTSGECLPKELRCNEEIDCLDYSDEDHCKHIEKNLGYDINKTPPPLSKKKVFELKYLLRIFSIADITYSEGTAVVDLFIGLIWTDPRLKFWNPAPRLELKHNKIWTPVIAMADASPNGFQVSFETYRSSYQALSFTEKLSSYKDPYMGEF